MVMYNHQNTFVTLRNPKYKKYYTRDFLEIRTGTDESAARQTRLFLGVFKRAKVKKGLREDF